MRQNFESGFLVTNSLSYHLHSLPNGFDDVEEEIDVHQAKYILMCDTKISTRLINLAWRGRNFTVLAAVTISMAQSTMTMFSLLIAMISSKGITNLKNGKGKSCTENLAKY